MPRVINARRTTRRMREDAKAHSPAANPTEAVRPRMRVVWFYHRQTGLFHGRNLMTDDPSLIGPNTPPEHIAIEGHHFDPVSQRVDVETGEIVDRQPPQPSTDHEWNTTIRRWQLKPEVVAKEDERRNALERIRYLELKALRSLREHALGQAAAIDRLKTIDDEINQLRSILGM